MVETSLHRTLQEWRPPPLFRLREPVRLRLEAARIKAVFGEGLVERPGEADLEEVLRAVRASWQARKLEQLSWSHLRRSPWVLFLGTPPRLGEDPAFVDAYLRLLEARPRSQLVAALLHVFLVEYPVKSPTFDRLRAGLARLLAQSTSPRLSIWWERCQRLGLLEADGPRRFATAWLEARGQETTFPTSQGLTGDMAHQGFVVAAYDMLLHHLVSALYRSGASTPLLDQVLRVSADPAGGLRFPSRRALLAAALLLPFADPRVPGQPVESIKSFLLEHYGHPRVKVASWHGVQPEAIEVFMRWVVQATLDAFFDVVDATAKPEHWLYRRSFWEAYRRHGYLTDAWVVLGRHARQEVNLRLSHLKGSYGILRGSQSDQSVLLMKIGDLVIAEWSHEGACRIWRRSQGEAPRLYQQEYDAAVFRDVHPFKFFRHYGSAVGAWQSKVAAFIRDYTGVRIDPRSYMPR